LNDVSNAEPAVRDSAGILPSLPPSRGQWIFLGPNGLRAGWSILAFAVICGILIVVCGFVIGPFVHVREGVLTPLNGLLLELSQLIPAIAATCVMAMLEHRPALFYGYQGRARAARLISGLVWGFVAISCVIVLLRRLGYLEMDGRAVGGMTALRYGVEWGAVFLCVGVFEETAFRGYLQFTITRGIGFWWGAFLFAALFGFMHRTNPGESPVGLVGAGGASVIFCLSLWYTGSLWWAVGFHAAWDWGQSFFYGTADSGLVAGGHFLNAHPVGPALWSGGTTGPEGSVIVLPLLVVIAAGMWLWWGRRGERPFAGAAWKPGWIAERRRDARHS
jgi:uncharacterized protein